MSRPFVALNTACFSPALLENELFGHEAGAFTGACGTKRGAFELAAGGTLFLDEIGEMPLELQPKLLRVLEGHPFRRLGGERPISVSFRLVSATNRKLDEAVQQGKFRLDLYHRLRVVEVTLPPLRERGEDIELLAYAFLSKLTAALGKPELELAPEALRAICAYRWPGNVRELRNAIERAVILCKGPRVLPSDLPPEIRCAEPSLACGSAGMPPPRSAGVVDLELDHVVREHILLVYGECGESVAKAAKKLGIGRATLRRKLRDYRVIPADPSQPRRP